MTVLVENRLSGEAGVQVSNTTLAEGSPTGTITITSPGTRAVYDNTRTVHGLPTIRVASGYHRGDTPALGMSLPSAPWSVRWYLWHPSIPHSTGERRWIAAFGGTIGLSSYENASAQVGARLQPSDLAAAEVVPTFSGTAHGPAQWLRVEAVCDGVDTTVRFYVDHDTTTPRQMLFTGQVPTGPLDLTAFRFRRRTTLRLGDQGTEVTALQQELIDLGYDLSPWGADGDYGQVTYDAVVAFQQDYSLPIVDGEAGPETRSAMDLALGAIPDPMWLSHVAVADDGAWIGPAAAPPEPAPAGRLRVGHLPI